MSGGPEPMPERIYVTLIDAETRKLLAENRAGDLDTEYVHIDLLNEWLDAAASNGADSDKFKAQRDRLATSLEAIRDLVVLNFGDWEKKYPQFLDNIGDQMHECDIASYALNDED